MTLNTSYSLDDPRCLTGLYITDSNDGYYYKDSLKSPDRLIYTTVKYNSSSDTYNVIYGSGYYNFVIDNSIYGTAALTALPRIDSNHNANLIVGNYKTKEIINDNVIVNQSGYTSSCTILSSQYLLGKSDNDRITGSQGVQYVLQKGSSYSPEILNKAKQLVSSGGISYSAKVGNGAIQYIYNGGIASSTHILSTGGNQIISSGGVASNTLVEYGSSFSYSGQIVSNGGVAVSSIITNLGGQTIYSGGVGRYTSICGGKQTLYSSAIASDTFIYSGSQFVYSGGYASTTHVFSGGSQVVSSGVAEHTIIHSSGQVSVYAGGVTSNLYVQVGGNESVQSAGLDKNAIVEGSQRILPEEMSVKLRFWHQDRRLSPVVLGKLLC